MKITNSNPSFTGYSNIFANNIASGRRKFVLLSMKLDNLKENDLDKFVQIKKAVKFPAQPAGEDILSLFYIRPDKDNHFLFMNGKRLLWGEELEYISENLQPKDQENYKVMRDIYMKIYTFLASITRHVAEGSRENLASRDFYRVIEQSIRSMNEVTENPQAAIDITNNAIFRRDIDHNEIAGYINKKIDNSMRNFFGIKANQ